MLAPNQFRFEYAINPFGLYGVCYVRVGVSKFVKSAETKHIFFSIWICNYNQKLGRGRSNHEFYDWIDSEPEIRHREQ